MAWKYKVTKLNFEVGSTQIGAEVCVYDNAWPAGSKPIVRHYTYPNADACTEAAIDTSVKADAAAYTAMAAKVATLTASLLNVEKSLV